MLINCYWVINGGWELIGNGWVRLLSDRVPHSLCVLLIFICIWLYLTCWNLFGLFDSFYSGQWRLGFLNDSGAFFFFFFFFLVNQWHECVSKSTDVGHFIQVKSPDSIESILFDILTILIGFLIDSSEMIVEIGSLSSVLSLSLSFSFLFLGADWIGSSSPLLDTSPSFRPQSSGVDLGLFFSLLFLFLFVFFSCRRNDGWYRFNIDYNLFLSYLFIYIFFCCVLFCFVSLFYRSKWL